VHHLCRTAPLNLAAHPRALLRGLPTVDAAARLLRLEGELQQQAAAAALASRQLDKLQARVRLSTADLKSPIRQLQDAGAAQADVAVRLAEQQSALARQVSGLEEVVAALQGVGARQFQVGVRRLRAVRSAKRGLSVFELRRAALV
jgi:hypothetical protein